MKSIIRLAVISFVFSLVFLLPLGLSADPPGMPGNHGTNGDAPPGGGAPIGGGIIIFLAMAAAYGSKKIYLVNKAEY